MQESGPGEDTAPCPHRGVRRPRNFPLRPGCHFPQPGCSPASSAAAPLSPPRPVSFQVPPPGSRAYLGSQAAGGQQGAEQRESFPDLQERERSGGERGPGRSRRGGRRRHRRPTSRPATPLTMLQVAGGTGGAGVAVEAPSPAPAREWKGRGGLHLPPTPQLTAPPPARADPRPGADSSPAPARSPPPLGGAPVPPAAGPSAAHGHLGGL